MNEACVRKQTDALFKEVVLRCPFVKKSYSICKCLYMIFITVSEIFPDSISFAVEKCTGIKISSVSEKK